MADLPSPHDLVGQETALRAFEAAVVSGRVAGAYLLHGPAGVGRSLGATIFAHALLCRAARGLARWSLAANGVQALICTGLVGALLLSHFAVAGAVRRKRLPTAALTNIVKIAVNNRQMRTM